MPRQANPTIIRDCHTLRSAFEKGLLGDMRMPEDAQPKFKVKESEKKLAYFTLPMSLNYQRNSYTLWQSATKTYLDPETCDVFSIEKSTDMPVSDLREKLVRHKLALQPNKHIDTWKRISETFYKNWAGIGPFLEATDSDFQNMRTFIQKDFKSGFPYLSGPKIFHYWSYILIEYCGVNLKNRRLIEIAPDTHVIQASVKLGVIRATEVSRLTRDQISLRWREILMNSKLSPIDMHSPLWFWSRNSFQFEIPAK